MIGTGVALSLAALLAGTVSIGIPLRIMKKHVDPVKRNVMAQSVFNPLPRIAGNIKTENVAVDAVGRSSGPRSEQTQQDLSAVPGTGGCCAYIRRVPSLLRFSSFAVREHSATKRTPPIHKHRNAARCCRPVAVASKPMWRVQGILIAAHAIGPAAATTPPSMRRIVPCPCNTRRRRAEHQRRSMVQHRCAE